MVFSKKFTLICAVFLLCIIAIAVVTLKGEPFTGPVNDNIGWLFSILSWSAGTEGFLITIALFCSIPFLLRWPYRRILILLICFGFVLSLSFVTKSILKQMTQEPRPYTEVLSNLGKIDSGLAFYDASFDKRDDIIESVTDEVSHWRSNH